MVSGRIVLRALISQNLSRLTLIKGFAAETTMKQPETTSTSEGAADETVDEKKEEPAPEVKFVVFGGNGFVGSRVCETAHKMGLHVISINRSGRPTWLKKPWANEVEWVHGDALQPACYIDKLRGALGAVSCVGGFGSNATMYRTCGEANIKVIETAAAVKVPRFAFVSVYHDTLPGFVKQIGYFRGKIDAEAALQRCFGTSGVAIRPFFIHGTRHITESLGIPLQAIGVPLEKALSFIPSKQLANSIPLLGTGLIPPVRVESVAKAAVAAATDPAISQQVLDVWDIAKF